jgi:thioredoxin-dependent peroxiredoxin
MKTISAIIVLLFSLNASSNTNRWEGQPFAQFELADQHGKIKKNDDFAGQWKVVYFYPKDRTPGCTVEAQNFVDDYAKYQANNVAIIGVSYDDVESHKDFSDTYEMPFTLLADVDKKLAKAMDVDRILPWPHPSRQTFIVNPEGTIVKHFESVDPKSHSKELLATFSKLVKEK